MGKKKIRFILVLSVFILILATGFTCKGCLAWWTNEAEQVGKQTSAAIESIKTVSPDEEREVKWVLHVLFLDLSGKISRTKLNI